MIGLKWEIEIWKLEGKFDFCMFNTGTIKTTCWTSVPQTVWPHWGVLTVGVKARCSIEVVSLASGIFPVNFHTKWLLWNVHVHFDCAGSHKTGVAVLGCGIFPKFQYSMALVACPCAFRLRRLAPGSHKTRNLAQTSGQETSYRELVQRSCQETSSGDLVQRSCQETSYRDLANRALIEIFYRDLARRPLMEILHRDLLQRSCQEAPCRDLAKRPLIEILYRDLANGALIEILYRDLARRPLLEILYRDLVKRAEVLLGDHL